MPQSAEQSDLEREGVAYNAAQGYGATSPATNKEPPLLFGQFSVDPGILLRVLVGVYVGLFAMRLVADIAYYATVDARFPPGLGHLYPSEKERHDSISYTRQMLVVSMFRDIIIFCIVVTLIYFQIFVKADLWLRDMASRIAENWENSSRSGIGKFLNDLCVNTWELICRLCRMCYCECCECCCEPLRRWTANHSWRELLLGSVYLCIVAACLFLVSAPFDYWMLTIDLNFGFANALHVSTSGWEQRVFWEFLSILIMGIPAKFIFLFILKFRFGWVFMWVCMVIGLLFVQFNMDIIGPLVLNMKNIFPYDIFAVGRGFPLVTTSLQKTTSLDPWISLNRIYFKDGETVFSTKDKSKGVLQLSLDTASNSWTIASKPYGTVYARTSAGGSTLNSLDSAPWRLNGDTGYIGHRSGGDLRSKVMGYAREEGINIAEIYMVDGSHKDARANAFVGGFNRHIIGLYDTLFLGDHDNDVDYPALNSIQRFLTLSDGASAIQAFMEVIQDVNAGEAKDQPALWRQKTAQSFMETKDNPNLWSSAPTRAMTDDEIIAILAHELAHPALNHLVEQTSVHMCTLLVTFAALGWAAHSPLLALSLGLTAPLLHVGACAYDLFVGPPLHFILKFGNDFLVRYNEYEADAYVAKISERYGTALQTALAKLAINTNQDPDIPYWYEALITDHPSAAHRWAHIQKVKEKKYGKDTQYAD